MLASKDQFKSAFEKFMNKEFTPKIPVSKYPGYFSKLGIVSVLVDSYWSKIATSDGLIELDSFYQTYSNMFELTDKIELYGFTFTKNDLNELFNTISTSSENIS